jgi:hypothetical protein
MKEGNPALTTPTPKKIKKIPENNPFRDERQAEIKR